MASGNPDIGVLPRNPSRARVWHERNPIKFESPWSGRTQQLRRYGKWRVVYEWEDLEDDDLSDLGPLFDRDGTFSVYDPTHAEPSGAATVAQLAALKVNGASQTGTSLIVDGGPNSTLIFRADDIIGLNLTGQVFRVRTDCTTNGSGQATIQLCQYIGASPADNEDIIVSYVPIFVTLDRDPERATVPPMLTSFTVEMTEAL